MEDLESVVAFQDGDGLLGFDEFLRLVEARGNKEDKGQSFKQTFGMYEMDRTGCTTPGSFRGKDNFLTN